MSFEAAATEYQVGCCYVFCIIDEVSIFVLNISNYTASHTRIPQYFNFVFSVLYYVTS